jgi:DNA polymerase elongation subunit (family B)
MRYEMRGVLPIQRRMSEISKETVREVLKAVSETNSYEVANHGYHDTIPIYDPQYRDDVVDQVYREVEDK